MYKLQLKDSPQRGLWLVGEKIRLGAGKDNEWVLDGLGINEHHAQILIDGGKLELHALSGSCFVNDEPVDHHCALIGDDEIRIGQQRLVILDSKQLETCQNTPDEPPVEVNVSTDMPAGTWQLVSKHPKLQDLDFSIVTRATIGRGKHCDFVVPYKLLSREHAEFLVDQNGVLLTDLGSSNGTFVNGKRVKQARLKGNETITFAKLPFTIRAPQRTPAEVDTGDEQEINRTMIRPVLTMEVALAHITQETEDTKATLEINAHIEESLATPESASDSESHPGRWLAIAVAVAGLAVGCWWLLPFTQ
jgi:pSer/pThr/pTyr-binding forkhead associated (FHA) protein